MSIAIDLPPTMAQEVREYVTVEGTTIEQFLFDQLKAELKRKHEANACMSRLDALVRKTSSRLTGEAYRFNRADAYDGQLYCGIKAVNPFKSK